MAAVAPYEYIWSLDTDAFLLGPITYDVFGLMASRNATYGYIDVNVETPEVASGLADCVGDYLRSAHPAIAPTMLRNFSSRPAAGGRARWDGSKFYTNFQVARREFGASVGFTRLFEHIDRDGGIYRHRWGADPILFLAVTILLQPEQVVHFDDVPYLHQHLVANLPNAPHDELTLPKEFEHAAHSPPRADRSRTGAGEAADAGGAAASVSAMLTPTARALRRSVASPVVIFASDASHVAAAIEAIARWAPPEGCAMAAPLTLRLCTPAALGGARAPGRSGPA